jgi:hypothetical protein
MAVCYFSCDLRPYTLRGPVCASAGRLVLGLASSQGFLFFGGTNHEEESHHYTCSLFMLVEFIICQASTRRP